MQIIDTHSHFNLTQFDGDREEVIARMEAAGVGTLCVGVDEETSVKAVALAGAHKSIWAIVGQHPTEWYQAFSIDAFTMLAQQPRVVAIGECGLDYFREQEREHVQEQRVLFESQIALAKETDLPLMLHIRPTQGTTDAYEDALDILEAWKRGWPTMRGTAHFFVGTKEIADRFLALGFHISFSGVITIFPEYEEIVRHVPLERILPETDAPFASPLPWRGKRCEPQYVLETIKKIAEIKMISLQDVEYQLTKNTKEIFTI
ncbi:TatD family hydrolase [Candidatus Nomurabacteria bacterium]|nr:TatD family hydrolase [Candidatus Nomurabacteria bacterium]